MKPAPLQPGDTIAVVAPASPPKDPAALQDGIAHLRGLGYAVETGRNTFEPYGYLAGPDADRIDEFNAFLRRDDVKAIFCVRGGYGALRILAHLDYAAARRHPKLIVGYSDITALHLAFYREAGLPGLSGPMVAVEWPDVDPATERLFWEMMGGAAPDPLLGPAGEELIPVRPGTAEGVLLGGNLSLVARLVGTPYLPSLDGALLFLEEVGEPPYRIDGLFAQLRLAGILDRLGGLILGGFTEWDPEDDRPTFDLDELFAQIAASLPCPVARGLVYGHFPVKNTIPLGVRGRLSVSSNAASLAVLEPVVEP